MRDANENRKKKRPREILGARSTRKEGLPPEPESLNYALLSQREKNDWLMPDDGLSERGILVVYPKNGFRSLLLYYLIILFPFSAFYICLDF